MNLKISEGDSFWSSLPDEGGEFVHAKRDCGERLNTNVYVYRFLKGEYYRKKGVWIFFWLDIVITAVLEGLKLIFQTFDKLYNVERS